MIKRIVKKYEDTLIPMMFMLALVVSMFAIPKAKEMYNLYLLEKAEHEVDSMTVMQGVYIDNGHIVTEDGHEWIWMWDEPKQEGTEMTMLFQTNNSKDKKDWEILYIQEN